MGSRSEDESLEVPPWLVLLLGGASGVGSRASATGWPGTSTQASPRSTTSRSSSNA